MSSRRPRRSAIANPQIGADRELALLHMPGGAREAVRALFELDSAMGDVVARATDPALGRIKLAWWREQLERLDSASPPAEPRLQAVANHLLPAGLTGTALGGLEAGWATLLDDPIAPDLVAERGALLFSLGGRILGGDHPALGDAGALYALASVARRGVPELKQPAAAILAEIGSTTMPRALRPLTMLARAAARDAAGRSEPEGGRARTIAMLAHRWSGRIG